MGVYYLKSERLNHLIEQNTSSMMQLLDSSRTRRECLTHLRRIYSHPCDIALSESDYKNLYDIYYVLHTNGCTLTQKCELSIKFVEQAKYNHNYIIPIFKPFVK